MTRRPKRNMVLYAVLFAAVAVVSVAVWLLPGALGVSSSFDSAVIAVWLVVVGVLFFDFRRRDNKRKRLMRTFYIDTERRRAFSPSIGMISYDKGCDLLDSMIVALADDHSETHMDPPDDFNPTLAVETSAFACTRDQGVPTSEFVRSADDVTVTRWEGRLVNLRTDKARKFTSAFEMEDIFCPGSSGCAQPCIAGQRRQLAS